MHHRNESDIVKEECGNKTKSYGIRICIACGKSFIGADHELYCYWCNEK